MSQDEQKKQPNPESNLFAGIAEDLNPVNMLLGLPDDILEDFRAVAIAYDLPKLKEFFDLMPGVQEELDNAKNQNEFMPAIQAIFMKIIKEGTQGMSLFPSMDEVVEALKTQGEEKPDGTDTPK